MSSNIIAKILPAWLLLALFALASGGVVAMDEDDEVIEIEPPGSTLVEPGGSPTGSP